MRNHPSWEDDTAAQAALGPIIAKWLAQGVLEYVQWDDRQPVLLQPCGAVPKGTAPFFRLITDARFGNSTYSDWGGELHLGSRLRVLCTIETLPGALTCRTHITSPFLPGAAVCSGPYSAL